MLEYSNYPEIEPIEKKIQIERKDVITTMEQSLRLLLTSNTKPTEQSLLNVFNKLSSPSGSNFSSDLFILLAERFFDLPHPLQRHIVDKAETMVNMYNRLQEPMNQFQVRSLIIQAQIFSYRAQNFRGQSAADINLKAIEYIHRALKIIQSTQLYQPLSLRAVFTYYQIAYPFFPSATRHYLHTTTPIAIQLLEPNLVPDKFDATLKLYIALNLLNGSILDEMQKSDEASKQIQKLFTLVPQDQTILRFSLLHILTHFSRKSPGALLKIKLDMNDQLQKAVILYQGARSNNATQTKDLSEAFKICTAFLDAKRDSSDENSAFETLIGEIGRLAAQFGQTQLAQECYQRASNARYPLGRLHAILINAELSLSNEMTPEERADIIVTCSNCMSLAFGQGDLVLVQDAAALLWTHALKILHRPGLVKRHLLTAVDTLARAGSQENLMRSEIHFTLAKIFEADRDNAKAIDQLKKAIHLDYLANDHPSKLQHPFDRFLVPYYKMFNVSQDAFGQQVGLLDQVYAPIVQSRRASPAAIKQSLEILNSILEDETTKFDAIEAAHFSGVWSELIRSAATGGQNQHAVDACNKFIRYEFDIVQFDTAVETQCEATVYAIPSAILCNSPSDAIQFLKFSLNKGKALKIPRLQFNAIAAIWNSFFSKQEPSDCNEYIDVLNDCITTLFEADFEPCKKMIGQVVNFFVKILLEACAEPPPTAPTVPQQPQQKKKGSSLDPVKQKQLKLAEDTALKSISYLTSVYEKKALVDRIVEIFARKNALPPNQSDQETSTLIQLATIMNEKVQHKQETLTSIFSSLQNMNSPALYAVVSDKANKLDLGQLTIDSATKYIEMIPKPTTTDEFYYLGLARFNKGSANLKLIQPELQEFSCQDKLRVDAANDFLRSAQNFHKAGSEDNAKLSLSLFCSTVAVGEGYPKFRSFISEILYEALQLSRIVIIGDDLRVCLYRIYLRVLIDHKDWTQCRKIIHDAITCLEKGVHNQLWELNLIVTANTDCAKSQTPLIDEMLRVKQLGDSKYQSRLWSFVADLATDKEVQEIALTKATDVLKPADIAERFKTSMDHAKWLKLNNYDWSSIEEKLEVASQAADEETNQVVQLQRRFEIEYFRLRNTKIVADFENAVEKLIKISSSFWAIIAELNQIVTEEESVIDKKKSSARKGKTQNDQHKTSVQTPKEEQVPDFKALPTTISSWQSLMKQVDKHKAPTFDRPCKFVNIILDTIDIIKETGREFSLLLFWYIAMLISKHQVQNERIEQLIYMKFSIFIDRLDAVSQLPYNTDFSITDQERSDWSQKVERYQADPPSDIPPIRATLIQQCYVLIEIGDYRPAITMAQAALAQTEQLSDPAVAAEAHIILSIISERSGDMQKAIEHLQLAAPQNGLQLPIIVKWFMAAFRTHAKENRSTFISALCEKYRFSCVNDNQTIYEIILNYKLYIEAAKLLNTKDCLDFYFAIKGAIIMPNIFLPSIDVRIAMFSNFFEDPDFPDNILEYKQFGNELIKFIESISYIYQKMYDEGEENAIPALIRYIEVVNIFGKYVVLYRPKIRQMKIDGLDYSVIGSHVSLVNEFMDKESEPLIDISPTAAIMYFNSVQCLSNIPLKQQARINVYMGKCLNSVATDSVTKQNAVKFLWKSITQLIELEDYNKAEDISKLLISIFRESDIEGTIQMFVTTQNIISYKQRIRFLENETPPENREYLYIKENKRIVERFNKPSISPMYNTTQRFFKEIPSGSALFRQTYTIEDIRKLCTTNKVSILIVDYTSTDPNQLEGTIISYDGKDIFAQGKLFIDLDSVAMKISIFKQIIAPPKLVENEQIQETNEDKKKDTPSPRSKKAKKDKKQEPIKAPTPQPQNQIEFGEIALKASNPEFDAFITDLTEKLTPITSKLPENSEGILLISSLESFHTIPFTAIEIFTKFNAIYHDYSIVSAISREQLLKNISKDV